MSRQMRQQRQIKLHCQSLLGAFALVVGIGGAIATPALATPDLEATSFKLANFKLAQASSRVNSPTPLNLRPRTHIPLPTNRSSRDYYRHSGYGRGSRGAYGRFKRHERYDYGYRHDRDYHRDRRGTGETVIIINPASSRHSNYSNYNRQDSYIRIIGK